MGPAARRAPARHVPIPEPGPGEVRIKDQAIPLNLNDIERINGGNMMVIPPLPCCPGMEVMGVVDAARRRRRGVARQAGGVDDQRRHRRLCRIHDLPGTVSMFEMPEDIPLPDAAALFFPFHLAWLGLFERGKLQAGESVLIHAAAGGAGSAAVQLAANAGARVFATAGSEEKLQALPRSRRRRRHQLPGAGLRRGGPRGDRQPRGRRGVRQRRRRQSSSSPSSASPTTAAT